jgi:hypothetical protein
MNHVRLFFVAWVTIALAAACSSSSTPAGTTPTDDGGGQSDSAADAASNGCTPSQRCGQGMTCCFQKAGDPGGTCTAPSACTGAVSYQCLNANDCSGGSQVCCLAGLNPATFDAAAFDGSLPPNLNLALTCNAACTGQQSQICKSSTECTGGKACVTSTQGGVTAGFCTTPDGGSEAGAAPSDAASGG